MPWTRHKRAVLCSIDAEAGVSWNNSDGSGSVGALGQRPGYTASNYSGAQVYLAVLQFRALDGLVAGRPGNLKLQVGSLEDPVLLTSTTSSGDDISVAQNVAVVCHCVSTRIEVNCAQANRLSAELVLSGRRAPSRTFAHLWFCILNS